MRSGWCTIILVSRSELSIFQIKSISLEMSERCLRRFIVSAHFQGVPLAVLRVATHQHNEHDQRRVNIRSTTLTITITITITVTITITITAATTTTTTYQSDGEKNLATAILGLFNLTVGFLGRKDLVRFQEVYESNSRCRKHWPQSTTNRGGGSEGEVKGRVLFILCVDLFSERVAHYPSS